jgi:hypothetical protein
VAEVIIARGPKTQTPSSIASAPDC